MPDPGGGIMTTARTRPAWHDHVPEIRGVGRAKDGCVTVEADVTGRITSLYVADFAMDDGPDRLAKAIVICHNAATASAIAQVEQYVHTDLQQRPAAPPRPNEPTGVDAETLAAEVARVNDATDRASGRAYSRDSVVFLEVATTGRIISAWLADYAGEHGGDRLADSILDSYTKAHAGAMAEGARVYSELRNGAHQAGKGGSR